MAVSPSALPPPPSSQLSPQPAAAIRTSTTTRTAGYERHIHAYCYYLWSILRLPLLPPASPPARLPPGVEDHCETIKPAEFGWHCRPRGCDCLGLRGCSGSASTSCCAMMGSACEWMLYGRSLCRQSRRRLYCAAERTARLAICTRVTSGSKVRGCQFLHLQS